jgi:hypothetical protein
VVVVLVVLVGPREVVVATWPAPVDDEVDRFDRLCP